jgi:hypothetical protein
MFECQAGGVACSCLLDTGAVDVFMDTEFAKSQGFHLNTSNTTYEVANGDIVNADGDVTAKFRVQGYSREMRFVCIKLGEGIDIILGDNWAKREQAIIDFGAEEPVYRPPSVWLGRAGVTLRPVPNENLKPGVSSLISARRAIRYRAAPGLQTGFHGYCS